MRYTAKAIQIEAILLDSTSTAMKFLKMGEFSVIQRDGLYILTAQGTVFAPIGECYLIRWPHGVDIMDKDEFEAHYEEAK